MVYFVKGLVLPYDESKDISIDRHVIITSFCKWITSTAYVYVMDIIPIMNMQINLPK